MAKDKSKTLKHHTADAPIDGNVAVLDNPTTGEVTDVIVPDKEAKSLAKLAEALEIPEQEDKESLTHYVDRVSSTFVSVIRKNHVIENWKTQANVMATIAPKVEEAFMLWKKAFPASEVTDYIRATYDPECPKNTRLASSGHHPHRANAPLEHVPECMFSNYSYNWFNSCLKAAKDIAAKREADMKSLAGINRAIIAPWMAKLSPAKQTEINSVTDPLKLEEAAREILKDTPKAELIELAKATGLIPREVPAGETTAEKTDEAKGKAALAEVPQIEIESVDDLFALANAKVFGPKERVVPVREKGAADKLRKQIAAVVRQHYGNVATLVDSLCDYVDSKAKATMDAELKRESIRMAVELFNAVGRVDKNKHMTETTVIAMSAVWPELNFPTKTELLTYLAKPVGSSSTAAATTAKPPVHKK